MVANELITNCFKHAFPDNRFGAINVTYERDETALRLQVSDDGVGLSEGAGSGRTVVRQLIEGLGGTIEWHMDQGTQVRVTVPIPAAVEHQADSTLAAEA
jgi:two-component sensor histidine kinase